MGRKLRSVRVAHWLSLLGSKGAFWRGLETLGRRKRKGLCRRSLIRGRSPTKFWNPTDRGDKKRRSGGEPREGPSLEILQTRRHLKGKQYKKTINRQMEGTSGKIKGDNLNTSEILKEGKTEKTKIPGDQQVR